MLILFAALFGLVPSLFGVAIATYEYERMNTVADVVAESLLLAAMRNDPAGQLYVFTDGVIFSRFATNACDAGGPATFSNVLFSYDPGLPDAGGFITPTYGISFDMQCDSTFLGVIHVHKNLAQQYQGPKYCGVPKLCGR